MENIQNAIVLVIVSLVVSKAVTQIVLKIKK